MQVRLFWSGRKMTFGSMLADAIWHPLRPEGRRFPAESLCVFRRIGISSDGFCCWPARLLREDRLTWARAVHSRSPRALRRCPRLSMLLASTTAALSSKPHFRQQNLKDSEATHLRIWDTFCSCSPEQRRRPLRPCRRHTWMVPDLQKSRPTQAGRLLNYLSL